MSMNQMLKSEETRKKQENRRQVLMKQAPVGVCKRDFVKGKKQMACWEPNHYPLNRSSLSKKKERLVQEIKNV